MAQPRYENRVKESNGTSKQNHKNPSLNSPHVADPYLPTTTPSQFCLPEDKNFCHGNLPPHTCNKDHYQLGFHRCKQYHGHFCDLHDQLSPKFTAARGSQSSSRPVHPIFFIPTCHHATELNVLLHKFTNYLQIKTKHGMKVAEIFNYIVTPPQHTLKPNAVNCTNDHLDNEKFEEVCDRDLPLRYMLFSIDPCFTENFRHTSKYSIPLAERAKDYWNTEFTKDNAHYHLYLFYFHFDFLHPTQMDVIEQSDRVNNTKIQQSMYS